MLPPRNAPVGPLGPRALAMRMVNRLLSRTMKVALAVIGCTALMRSTSPPMVIVASAIGSVASISRVTSVPTGASICPTLLSTSRGGRPVYMGYA